MIKLYSQEAENALLGLFLKEPKLFFKSKESLKVDDFYITKNKLVFDCLQKVYQLQQTTDPIILANYLVSISDIKEKEEWMTYLAELMMQAGIPTNLEEYINVIKDKAQARILEATLKEAMETVVSKEQPVQTLIEDIESQIFAVTKDRKLKDFSSILKLTNDFNSKLENIKKFGYVEGIKSGLPQLDEKLGGLKEGDFVIVAARPAMGKTAFALEFAKNVSRDKNVAFYSIEMPSEQLIQRLVATDSLIKLNNLQNIQYLSNDQQLRLEVALDNIKKLHLWIDDTPGARLNELVWKAKKLHSISPLDLIIIDYLQLIEIDSNRENRQLAVTEISRTLKALARELKLPIIALSQLSRRVEQRENKKPQMSDIRESGAIEQDADVIMFLYREAYYKEKEDMPSSEVHDLDVIISKHRNGPTGVANLKINMAFGKVTSSIINKEEEN